MLCQKIISFVWLKAEITIHPSKGNPDIPLCINTLQIQSVPDPERRHFLLVGRAEKISKRRGSGVVLIRCSKHLSWPILMRSRSGSMFHPDNGAPHQTPKTDHRQKLISASCFCDLKQMFSTLGRWSYVFKQLALVYISPWSNNLKSTSIKSSSLTRKDEAKSEQTPDSKGNPHHPLSSS